MTWTRRGYVDDEQARDLPEWMQSLVRILPTLTTSEVTRFAPIDGQGRHAAVLILLGVDRDLVLIERAHGDAVHSGQPAFPGGAVERFDANASAAALREAQEEAGIDRSSVRIVGGLPDLWVPVSGFVVSPIVGFTHVRSSTSVQDPSEVSRVEHVGIATLADPDNRVTVVHPSGYRGPGFTVHDMLVWGFTAGVIDALLEKSGWALPWDHTNEVPIDL